MNRLSAVRNRLRSTMHRLRGGRKTDALLPANSLRHRRGLRLEQLEARTLLSISAGWGATVSSAWFEEMTSGDAAIVSAATATSTLPASSPTTSGAASVVGQETAPSEQAPSEQWIVQLTQQASAIAGSVPGAASLLTTEGIDAHVVRGLGIAGMVLLETSAGTSSATVQNWLANNSAVAYYEPNAILSIDTIPNDPSFSQLWGMNNTGQTGGKVDADIDAPEAWNATKGSSSVVVGIIDTGVDYTHSDLAANIWTNPGEISGNGIDDDANGFVDDIHGYDFANNDGNPMDDHYHGTHVAGTIAAVGNNGSGVAGVNWSSSIMALKFLSSGGSGTTANAVRAVNYATMMRTNYGVNICATNNSWGGGSYDTALYNAIAANRDAGILFVAAAGNDGVNNDTSPRYPASYDLNNIIAVAATDHYDNRASFSCYGATTVDLAAPGVDIYSTAPGNGYQTLSGTSMATPHVTGVVALALATSPGSTAAQIKAAVLAGVDPVSSLAGKMVTGGRLNALGTLNALGLSVVGSVPSQDSVIGALPTDFAVDFSATYLASSIDAGDLTVNGVAATSFALTDADTVTFHYAASPVTTQGNQNMAIAAGAILRAGDSNPLMAWNASFRYDAHVMTVASTDPANGTVVALPFSYLDVTFDETVGAASIGINDLTLSQGTVVSAAMVDADTVRYTLTGITAEGPLTVNMAAGAVTDAFGNRCAAYSGSFTTDIGAVAFPTPLTSVAPLGGLIYTGSTTGTIAPAADTDSFTVALDAGQTLTALVIPATGLQPSVTITGPGGVLLGSATSPAAGTDAVLQTVTAATAGTYTITVSSVGGAGGTFTLQLTLNAALEAEEHGGATNDTLATAQDLSHSFLSLGAGTAQRGAVVGHLPAGAGTVVLSETFDAGPPLGAAWSTYSSTAQGRIQVTGSYGTAAGPNALVMDTSSAYALNEAVWTVNLTGVASPTLTFYQRDWSDDLHSFSGDFTGHYNADGVAISADGVTWHPVWAATSTNVWRQYTVDLAAQAAAHGITLGSNFQIKFQQYDNSAISVDGRAFDQIAITTPAASDDWYKFTLDSGQSSTLALSGSAAGAALRLYNAAGNLLATGVAAANLDAVIGNFTVPVSGTYYACVSGGINADYRLIVTRDASFDTEANDTFATAQPIAGGVLGSIGDNNPAPITVNWYDSGWWDATGYHSSANKNYFSGRGLLEIRDYFVFSLPAGRYISGAQLRLWNPSGGYSSPDPSETYAVFDVSTPISTLMSGGSGNTAMFADLGSGTLLASQVVSAADNNSTIPITLNADAINYLNAHLGGLVAFGGTVTTISGPSQQSIFGWTGESNHTRQLALTLGEPGDWYSINVPNAGKSICIETGTPGDGSGEFVNTLAPHIELYDPAGNLVASGTVGKDGRNESIIYTSLAAGDYRVRVTAKGETKGEYYLDMGRRLTVALPTDAAEGAGPVTATITIPDAAATDLTVNLTSSDPSRLSVPASVVIPAGQASISLPVSVIDDALLNGFENIEIVAKAAEYVDGNATITLHDDETAVLTVTLPSSAAEGDGVLLGVGTITSSIAPDADIVVQLASSDTTELTLPASVVLHAGQTTATFDATVIDDTLIDDTQTPSVTAHVENWTDGLATMDVLDNDRTMSIGLPTSGWETQTLIGAGTVRIGGTLPTDLVVSLSSGDSSELTLPPTVTILAGQTSATFDVALLDDGLRTGPRFVAVTATADGLPTATMSITVNDCNVDHYVFTTIVGPKAIGIPFSVTAQAYDVSNNVIAVYNSAVAMTAIGSGGPLLDGPGLITFVSGVWTGNVTIGTVDAGVTLQLDNGAGITGVSNPFDVKDRLRVASTSPAPGGTLCITGPLTLDVAFSEPVDPSSLTAGSLILSGMSGAVVTGVTLLPGNTTATFTIDGIAVEGTLTASIADGAILDQFGFPIEAFSARYAVDIGSVSVPVPLAAVNPLGSLVYGGSAAGVINPSSDTDSFTITLDAGQTLTAYVIPSSTLRPTLSIADPGGISLGSATATVVGRQVVLQTVPVATAGTYTLTIGSAGGTGSYTLQVELNAAVESESHGGGMNDTLATAQSLDAAFTSLDSNADRAAVLGITDPNGPAFASWNLDSNPGWTTQGQWAWGQPTGSGGASHGYHDPAAGHTGSNVFGVNLNGDYDAVAGGPYYLTTSAIDCSGRSNVQLSFWRWLNSDSAPYVNDTVEVSSDGVTWVTVYANPSTAPVTDNTWQSMQYDVSAVADNQVAVYVRWGHSADALAYAYSGWNIDDVSLSAPGSAGSDYYSFALAAGQSATIGLASQATGTTTGTATLDLFDAAHNLLASGVSSANMTGVIGNYVAPTAGTYYVQVAGSGAPYNLVVTRGAAFDTEANDTFATAQNINGAVLGSLVSGGRQRLFACPIGQIGQIVEIDPSTGAELRRFAAPESTSGGPDGLAFDGVSLFYINGYGTDRLWRLNPDTGAVIDSHLITGGSGDYDGLAALNGKVYILDYGARNILEFDPSTSSITRSVHVSAGIVGGLAGIAGPNALIATVDALSVAEIDPTSGTIIRTFTPTLSGRTSYYFGVGVVNGQIYLGSSDAGRIDVFSRLGAFQSSLAIPYSVAALGGDDFGQGDPGDWYSVNVPGEGNAIAISTSTPGDGAGEFGNTLAPHIELYDPAGNMVASGVVGPDGRNETISYESLAAGDYRVRVTAQSGAKGEYYLNASMMDLVVPANATEGDGTVLGSISIPKALGSDLVVNLSSDDPTRVAVPASVTILAGQTSVSVPISVIDDSLLNGLQDVSITATSGLMVDAETTTIHDNETASLIISLPPFATEGDGVLVSAAITVTTEAPTRDIVISLHSSDTSELTVPATVILHAGQFSATFDLSIVDDTMIDGGQVASISALVENWTTGTSSMIVIDNDRTLAVSLPADVWEGEGTKTGVGTVQIGGTLPTDLVIALISGDTTDLSVPATVTIPAGQVSATFDVTVADNADCGGAKIAALTARSTGFVDATAATTIHDNDLAAFVWDSISGPQTAAVPFGASLQAKNIDGETIPQYAGTATLSGHGTGGPVSVTPAGCTFASGVWTGNVAVHAVDTGVVLTIDDGAGHAAASNSFDLVAGPVDHFAWSTIASTQYQNVPFAVTLTAKDANGYTVTDYNGAADLSGWTGGGGNVTPPPGTPITTGNIKLLGADLKLGVNADGSLIVQDESLGANFLNNDFLLPGSPQASFSLGVAGNVYHNNAPAGSSAIAMTVSDVSAGGYLHVQAVGDKAGVHIIRDIWYRPSDHAVSFQVTLQNTTASAIANLAWLENYDPDQGFALAGKHVTANDVLLGGHYVEAVYYAPSYPGGLTIGMGSDDARAVASAEGFDVGNPFEVINSPADPNGTSEDIASNLAFNVGTLAAGASTTLTYSMMFASDRQAAEDLYQAQGLSPVTVTPTTATFAGGAWTGDITVLQTAADMYLRLDDGSGHVSDSAKFNVQSAPSEVHGSKWNDLDADGVWDAAEPKLSGWTIYLDQNNNSTLDAGESSTTTDANGDYAFLNLPAGNYTVADVAQAGWTRTYPAHVGSGVHTVVLADGQIATGKDFGDHEVVSPSVNGVFVAGSTWGSSFLNAVDPGRAIGYPIPVGSGSQLSTLPWTNINQIKVTFSEDVVVDKSDLGLSGVNLIGYDVANGTFSYDPLTYTATWTLPKPIGSDKLLLGLNADGSDCIKDLSGNPLDGDWTNPTSRTQPTSAAYPSGNGTAGGDFLFRFNVLPGDVNQDGNVKTTDALAILPNLNKRIGDAGYATRIDVDGDGRIKTSDALAAISKLNTSLPSGEPAAIAFASLQSRQSSRLLSDVATSVFSEKDDWWMEGVRR